MLPYVFRIAELCAAKHNGISKMCVNVLTSAPPSVAAASGGGFGCEWTPWNENVHCISSRAPKTWLQSAGRPAARLAWHLCSTSRVALVTNVLRKICQLAARPSCTGMTCANHMMCPPCRWCWTHARRPDPALQPSSQRTPQRCICSSTGGGGCPSRASRHTCVKRRNQMFCGLTRNRDATCMHAMQPLNAGPSEPQPLSSQSLAFAGLKIISG